MRPPRRPKELLGLLGFLWLACAMVSVPARVDKANWWGQQALWIGSAKCWARLRETTRRSKSPTMIPRTRPFGFCKATTRPRPMAWEMGNGTSAAASFDATRTKSRVQSSSSKTRRRVSAVRPEGPGVAFRVLRRLRMMVAAGSWSRLAGWNCKMSGSMAWYGEAGRRRGSCNSSSVLWFLGARGWAVRAWRAAVNSPW